MGQHCREPLLVPVDQLLAPLPAWATGRPWLQVRQLSSLLWDMVPVDLCSFVPSAEKARDNPVALMLMALAKQPYFVMQLADAVAMGLCMTAASMATCLHRILWDLDSCRDVAFEHNLNMAGASQMLGLCTTMLNLGMLELGDGRQGVALGPKGKRYHLVSNVPAVLSDCFLAAGSHYFPPITTSEDIPGYMTSWTKLLSRLPVALNVGHADFYTTAHIMRKLLVWLRSRYTDNMPITVGMTASWCRDCLQLTCKTIYGYGTQLVPINCCATCPTDL
jgi:hypothetical protein